MPFHIVYNLGKGGAQARLKRSITRQRSDVLLLEEVVAEEGTRNKHLQYCIHIGAILEAFESTNDILIVDGVFPCITLGQLLH